MVRLHVHGVKQLMRTKKKKRASIGTETDFERCGSTDGASPDGSFSIWMGGGATSTPEKGRSPVWYNRKDVKCNDHSAHSIVLFEETMISAKSKEKLNLSPIKFDREDPGSLVFHPSGKVHFRVSDIDANDSTTEGAPPPKLGATSSLTQEECNPRSMSGSGQREREGDSPVEISRDGKCRNQRRVAKDEQQMVRTNDGLKAANMVTVSRPGGDINERAEFEGEHRGFWIGSELADGIHDAETPISNHTVLKTGDVSALKCDRTVLQSGAGDLRCEEKGRSVRANVQQKVGQENTTPPHVRVPHKPGRDRRGIVWSVGDTIFNDVMADLENIGSGARHVTSNGGDFGRHVNSFPRSESGHLGINRGDGDSRHPFSSRSSIESQASSEVSSNGHRALSDITNEAHSVHAPRGVGPVISKERDQPLRKFPAPLGRKDTRPPALDTRILIGMPEIESLHMKGEFRYDAPYMVENTVNSRLRTPMKLPVLVPRGNAVFKSGPKDNAISYDSWRESNIDHRGHVDVEHIFQNHVTDIINSADIRPIPQSFDHTTGPVGIRPTSGGDPRLRTNGHRTETTNFTMSTRVPPQPRRGHTEQRHRIQVSEEMTPTFRPPTVPSDLQKRKDEVGHGQTRELSPKHPRSKVASQPSRVNLMPGRFSLDGKRRSVIRRNGDTNALFSSSSRVSRAQLGGDGLEGRKVPKLLEFFEERSSTLPGSECSSSRRKSVPLVRSTSSVSSRIRQFESECSSPDSSRNASFPGSGSRYSNIRRKTTSSSVIASVHSHHSARLPENIPAHRSRGATRQIVDGNVGFNGSVLKHTPRDQMVSLGSGMGILSSCSEDSTVASLEENKRISNNLRRHKTSRLTREAILLHDYTCRTKGGVIHFQRGEVVRVLSNWMDGRVRVRRYDDQTESTLPKKCLFFVSSNASLIGYCRPCQAPNCAPERGPTGNKRNPDTKKYLLQPYLVVRPHIAGGSRQVTVLRGEVVVIAPDQSRDTTGWTRVYVPRTQGFGIVPYPVLQPLTLEPKHH